MTAISNERGRIDVAMRNSIVPEMAALFYPYSGDNPVPICSFATT